MRTAQALLAVTALDRAGERRRLAGGGRARRTPGEPARPGRGRRTRLPFHRHARRLHVSRTPVAPPVVFDRFEARGQATQLGRFDVVIEATVDFGARPVTGVGTYTFTAANGDLARGRPHRLLCARPARHVLITEHAVIDPDRSTGRFAGLRGPFTVERLADAATGVGGRTDGTVDGTISLAGALECLPSRRRRERRLRPIWQGGRATSCWIALRATPTQPDRVGNAARAGADLGATPRGPGALGRVVTLVDRLPQVEVERSSGVGGRAGRRAGAPRGRRSGCPSRARSAPAAPPSTVATSEPRAPAAAAAYQPVRLTSTSVAAPPTTSESRSWSGSVVQATTTAATSPAAASTPSTATARRNRPRVTSTTPQQASTTSASANATGISPAPLSPTAGRPGRVAVGVAPSASTQGLVPATAARAPEASPSGQHGAERAPRLRHRRRGAAGARRAGRRRSRCGPRCGRPGPPGRPDEQGVAVAVEADLPDPLAVAGGLALHPVLPTAAAPVRRPAGRQGAGPGPRRPSSRASAPRGCRAAARRRAPVRPRSA